MNYLISSKETPGSPQLNSFGPSMILSKELLKKGESDAVLEYLDLCKVFGKTERGRFEKWKSEIRNGREPDFKVLSYYGFG